MTSDHPRLSTNTLVDKVGVVTHTLVVPPLCYAGAFPRGRCTTGLSLFVLPQVYVVEHNIVVHDLEGK